jgi:indolepyruvate ferredoxin oxidoreductase
MMTGFSILARLKRLRGTTFDIFGYSEERRMERRLLARYEADLELVRAKLAPGRIEAAAALLSVPALIRGFGHVKQANVEKAEGERQRLIERLKAEPAEALKAAE